MWNENFGNDCIVSCTTFLEKSGAGDCWVADLSGGGSVDYEEFLHAMVDIISNNM